MGNLEGGFFSGGFGRYVKWALEMEHLSRCRSSVGEPGRMLLFRGLRKIRNEAREETSV
jgi:hypothetical protein